MAEAFTKHSGVAVPILSDNIDTDQIIPSREMKAVSQAGLGEGLFAGWRYKASGSREPDPEFVLNKPVYMLASILISGANFGCGSSREHAVWALHEYGIRAIIAESFGEIFYGNCARNGILPIILERGAVEQLAGLARLSDPPLVEIDLVAQHISCGTFDIRFEIGAYTKRLLVEGLDPIRLTLKDSTAIDAFKQTDIKLRPWIYSAA